MGRSNMKYVIENFVHPNDAKVLMKFFDKNDHLCADGRAYHAERNIHYADIPDKNKQVKDILLYLARKNEMFVDHFFSVRVELWHKMRLCRWKKGHSMPLHIDRQEDKGDLFHFSSLIYLNDDYKGGELFFKEENKMQKYKLKALSCMIFPSGKEFAHGVKEILKGKKIYNTIMVRTKKIDTTFIHQEIISGKICDELIDFYESGEGTAGVPKVRGMMSGDKKPILNRAAKDCEESYYRGFPQNYRDALEKVCNNYKKKYEYSTRSSAPWQVGPVIKIQKYYPGTSYSALHYENQGFGISLYRHLVFMTYLNDIKTGGGTFWHYQNLTTKPKKGLTVIWPAIWTHTHKGLPAPKELKYICTGWYEWENNLD